MNDAKLFIYLLFIDGVFWPVALEVPHDFSLL